MEITQVAEYLVVDSGGFIKNAPLHQYGEQLITMYDVIDEIKDKPTKQRLLAMPFELTYKTPDSTSIQKVAEFAKKTGDYGNLSLTDLKILALTYMLEAEHVGTDHLSDQPILKPTIEISSNRKRENGDVSNTETVPNIVGFVAVKDDEEDEGPANNLDDTEKGENEEISEKLQNASETSSDIEPGSSSNSDGGGSSEGDDEEDDNEGWITPKNFAQKRLEMLSEPGVKERKRVKVACMTTDFAMQNVLIQMGLHVVSVDGVIIQQTKTWIKRCYACFKIEHDVTKVFCPKCGNKTLKRVSVSLNADGSMKIHISTKRPLTCRGKKYSLPAPQGGKHAFNPILCADQPMPQQHLSKAARAKINALDPDFVSGNSPFSSNDVTSRSALINVTGHHKYWMKRNPNAVGKSTGNRKKRSS